METGRPEIQRHSQQHSQFEARDKREKEGRKEEKGKGKKEREEMTKRRVGRRKRRS